MTPVGLPPFCEIGKAYKGEGVRVPGLPPLHGDVRGPVNVLSTGFQDTVDNKSKIATPSTRLTYVSAASHRRLSQHRNNFRSLSGCDVHQCLAQKVMLWSD